MLSFQRKDVLPSCQCSMVGAWSLHVHYQSLLQDLGDSSKNLIVVFVG